MLGLEEILLIVGARLIAAPLRHGYATESTVDFRVMLVSGTRVTVVIVCQPRN
jgi:hypothetical protein